MDLEQIIQVGAVMEHNHVVEVTPDSRALTCVVVDAVDAADLKEALLTGSELGLRPEQVWTPSEYVVIGAHEVRPYHARGFEWIASALHGTMFCQTVDKGALLRLLVQLQISQMQFSAPAICDAGASKTRRMIETECKQRCKVFGRLSLPQAIQGRQKVQEWEAQMEDLDLTDLPSFQCETFLSEKGEIRQRPFQHRKAVAVVTGACPEAIRSALLTDGGLSLDPAQVHLMSQFLIVAGHDDGRQYGFARGNTQVCLDLLKLIVQIGVCDIEWRTLRRLDCSRWLQQRAVGSALIMSEMAWPMLRVVDDVLSAWRAERKAERTAARA